MNRRAVALLAALLLTPLFGGLDARAAAPSPGPASTASVNAPAGNAPAGNAPAVMLVMDTSDSMNEDGGSGKSTKMDGARQALIDFVRAIPASTRVGLRVYPGSGTHTDPAGCSVGDPTVPLSSFNLSTVDATIRGLSASGNTPTAPALLQAANDLKAANFTEATIVLVSDGESNCGGDPCEIASQIAATGIDVTVNTVGFQISEQGKAQLTCISDKTDGLYADADDNAQLARQLDQLSRPLLDVRLDYPASVKAAVGADAQGLVTVDGTITNVGAGAVSAAQATFSFTGTVKPTVLSPRRKLGNLAPGASTAVRWQFRPPLLEAQASLSFRVDARGRNSAPTVQTGALDVANEISLADAGPLLKDAKRIAVLGDSYSSGEGGGSYESGTDSIDNSCHRSRRTYAVPLWDATAADGRHADVFACSGAVTDDIFSVNKHNPSEPSQLDRLRESQPYDAVLMTMGGNDVDFAGVASLCIAQQHCERRYASKVDDAAHLWLRLADVYRSVEDTLNSRKQMRRRAGRPGALIVLAYPAPFPMQSTNNCSFAYNTSEQRFFQQLLQALNTAAEKAVASVAAEGRPVYFVPDTVDAFQPDHTYCNQQPYINKLKTAKDIKALGGGVLTYGEWLSPALLVRTKLLNLNTSDTVKSRMLNNYQEQVHPNALGYRAETVELIRWSTTEAARRPVTRTAPFPLEVAAPGPVVDVSVGPSGGSAVTVTPGGVLQIQGSGLPPSSEVTLKLRSDPVFLGSAVTDPEGNVKVRVRVPTGVPVGQHRLEITARDDQGTVTATFSSPVRVDRARPGWLIPLAGVGLLSSTGGALVWRRRRAQGS